MVCATFAAFAALSVAFTAMELFPFLGLQSSVDPSTSMTTQDYSTLDSAAAAVAFTAAELFPFQVLLLLAATAALFTAVAFIHLHHASAAAGNNRRLSELVPFVLCGAAGILEFSLFVQPLGVVDDAGALARALGRAAVDALPAAATVVFFLGITLVIAHIRAGGEGGGGIADNRRVPVPVDLLKKMALGAAAALLSQMAVALLFAKSRDGVLALEFLEAGRPGC